MARVDPDLSPRFYICFFIIVACLAIAAKTYIATERTRMAKAVNSRTKH